MSEGLWTAEAPKIAIAINKLNSRKLILWTGRRTTISSCRGRLAPGAHCCGKFGVSYIWSRGGMHPGVGAGKSWPGGEAKLGVAGSRILVEWRWMPERRKGLVSLLRPCWSCVCWGDVVLGRLTCARMDLLSAMRSAPLDAKRPGSREARSPARSALAGGT